MDIDYIISGLLLTSAAALAAYLLGHARGRLDGFNECSKIWANTYRPSAVTRGPGSGKSISIPKELI